MEFPMPYIVYSILLYLRTMIFCFTCCSHTHIHTPDIFIWAQVAERPAEPAEKHVLQNIFAQIKPCQKKLILFSNSSIDFGRGDPKTLIVILLYYALIVTDNCIYFTACCTMYCCCYPHGGMPYEL